MNQPSVIERPTEARVMGLDNHDPMTVLAGRHLSAQLVARQCKVAGWTNIDKLLDAIATGYAESSGYERAEGPVNSNGTVDRGFWQINSRWVDQGSITVEECFHIEPATRFAYQLYRGANYTMRPWVAYTSGAYERFFIEATRGVANGYRYWRGLPFLIELADR